MCVTILAAIGVTMSTPRPEIREELLRSHTPQGVLSFAILTDGQCAIYEAGELVSAGADMEAMLQRFLTMSNLWNGAVQRPDGFTGPDEDRLR